MRGLRLAAVAVLMAGSLVACGGAEDAAGGDAKSGASASEPAAKESKAPADVKLVKKGFEDHEVWGDHAYVVHWELTNTGDAAGNFYAGLDFLDADGDVLGSTGITAEKVGPGKTAKGDASPLDVEIDKGEMGDIKDARVSEVERMDY
ncbi:hypothetical protein [Streptomyces tendae]|uniref:hypothetical protein n=1 Tax=Streptomyces tendae TaxID=1932 RepID=UPI003414EE70